MEGLLYPFVVLSAVGLAASLVVHVFALFGIQSPLGTYTGLLVVGIFIVWLPTVIVAGRLGAQVKQKHFWKAVLRGCPEWLRRAVYLSAAYAGFNFTRYAMLADDGRRPQIGEQWSATQTWFTTGHLMVFYCVALAVLYSATHTASRDAGRRCAKGHLVGPLAQYCEECGSPVLGPLTRGETKAHDT